MQNYHVYININIIFLYNHNNQVTICIYTYTRYMSYRSYWPMSTSHADKWPFAHIQIPHTKCRLDPIDRYITCWQMPGSAETNNLNSKHCVDAFSGQHTSALDRAKSKINSSEALHNTRLDRLYQAVRPPVSGAPRKPTIAASEGTPSEATNLGLF
jgi:hypothetical protein